ncbi:MAG: cytochrome c family protein [Proteobacteria bacterium]|nr:cytochrome c family protein [Pseudomonadota bacterium]MBU1139735.1 cytochrome c family protein [Pseudomonadota bacterium]MBU1232118.1 cytochrome c family protein [Pseudomonadota bacterium]MBU1418824.1 cytochrome c family protein [Pseudomonadota bacterium]MBU1453532.1 cytochrome c family protein [Pseudomonadota bacterium]
MKKVSIALCLTFAFASASAPVWALAGHGPETIDLKAAYKVVGEKNAVIFPHHKHQEKVECAKCHKDVKGGGPLVVDIVELTGTSNDFHKKFCWSCHVEMKVPKGKSCKTCHR